MLKISRYAWSRYEALRILEKRASQSGLAQIPRILFSSKQSKQKEGKASEKRKEKEKETWKGSDYEKRKLEMEQFELNQERKKKEEAEKKQSEEEKLRKDAEINNIYRPNPRLTFKNKLLIYESPLEQTHINGLFRGHVVVSGALAFFSARNLMSGHILRSILWLAPSMIFFSVPVIFEKRMGTGLVQNLYLLESGTEVEFKFPSEKTLTINISEIQPARALIELLFNETRGYSARRVQGKSVLFFDQCIVNKDVFKAVLEGKRIEVHNE